MMLKHCLLNLISFFNRCTNVSYIHETLGCNNCNQVYHAIIEIDLDGCSVILKLYHIVNKGCQLLVVNCGHELLSPVNDAHYLPPKMTIFRDAPVLGTSPSNILRRIHIQPSLAGKIGGRDIIEGISHAE